jgi:anti-anti-sigma regulatory factor
MDTTVDRPSPAVAVIGLEGELDASNFGGLIETGQRLYADGARLLILDLAGLTFMASSGIVAVHSLTRVFEGHAPDDLEAGWQALHDIGADVEAGVPLDHVRLVAPGPAVDRVLDRTGLKRLIPIYATREAALAGEPAS